jgi:hypothetical protein
MGTMSVGKDAITQYLAKSKAESATAVSHQLLFVYARSFLALHGHLNRQTDTTNTWHLMCATPLIAACAVAAPLALPWT